LLHTRYAIIVAMRSFGGGLAVGLLTLWLQGVLPGAWNHLANSGAVWCLAAFAAAALLRAARGTAIAAGTLTLFGAVIGYYAGATVFLHDDISPAALQWPLIWLCVALVAGPVYGLAGAAYRSPYRGPRLLSVVAVGAVFLAEAAYLLFGLAYRSEAGIMMLAGLVLPVVLFLCAKPYRTPAVAPYRTVPAPVVQADEEATAP
jgi:hypothetical protein